ncbi:hypothetical protein [Nakamurella sp. PAMC28650]|uniref:hypothetical protein n=1 Tax=Nakamurella sp. PAMC28650 TaxID=2762325 RepID=UPI00164E0821|nr:hypothetical protein [Nakamurella sp. PAMC28650]QNK83131.1 hypothetical protein H7F38_11055 [Nakamurella sp. PAMC28650]
MPDGNPVEETSEAVPESSDLQDELDGAELELKIAREELLAACIAESSALSSLNHMRHYLGVLHDRWADPSDVRSLEEVVEQRVAESDAALAETSDLRRRAADVDPLQQRVGELEQQLREQEEQLGEIVGSRLYRTLSVYRRGVERLLPAGTKRRERYRRLV